MAKARKTNPWLVIGVIALIAVVGLLAYSAIPQTVVTEGGQVLDQSQCADATGILTVNGVNALNKGSAVSSPTITAGVEGSALSTSVTSGTTTFPVGSEVELLVSKADYLDTTVKFTMPCGGKVLEVPMYYSTSDNPSIRIKNDDGDYVTDAIADGAINQTNLALGETFKMDIEFSGTSLESSGEGVYVIEFPAGSGANITKVELSGASSTNLPMVHTTNNAGSKVVAFTIPAVVGSEKSVHTLTVELTATKDLSGGVYTDWYAKQYFIDDDGTVSFGVEDSDGTAKYENTLDFDFFINSA